MSTPPMDRAEAIRRLEEVLHCNALPPRANSLIAGLLLTCGSRDVRYGDPHFNLSCQAALINVYRQFRAVNIQQNGAFVSATHDAAMEMDLTKIARIACGVKLHEDNYHDGQNYTAIALECAVREGIATTAPGPAVLNGADAGPAVAEPAREQPENTPRRRSPRRAGSARKKAVRRR